MNWKKIALSTVVIVITLFTFGLISQGFPWGIPATQVVSASTEVDDPFITRAEFEEFQPNELTTALFDDTFKGKISTFNTNKTFSWIISTDIENWKPMKYFTRELVNLFLVGFLLSQLLSLTVNWENKKRMLLIFYTALAGAIAIYGSQMNWWHVPIAFHGGLIVNLVISWLLAAGISARYILKPQTTTEAH